jgi:hypothetical protein
LDTFDGVGRYLAEPEDIRQIRQWREQDDYRRWQDAVAAVLMSGTIETLKEWRSFIEDSANDLRIQSINPEIENVRDVIVAWRFDDRCTV